MSEFDTRAVQVGQSPDPVTGAIVPPITLASTFVLDQVDVTRSGYDYSRSGNPTRDAYQVALANLESGGAAVAFPSGLSAEDSLIRVLTRPGDTVLYGRDAYGGTGRLFTWVLPTEGRSARRLDTTDPAAIRESLAATGAQLVWLETPSNPRLEVSDIAAAAELAHAAGAYLVVDNTFATPVFQRPLELGADVVVHSTTKFVGGHSDLIGGAAIFADGLELHHPGLSGSTSVAEEVLWWQNATGAVPGAFDCWLAARGLRTLPVRVRQAAASAQAIAETLTEIPGVTKVHYPGLPDDPGHVVASRQMSGFGAIVSFALASPELARRVAESTTLFRLAVSLGAAESLIEYPFAMTHQALASTADAAPDRLVRLAIGLEDPADLIADLRQVIARAKHNSQ
ncbi:MAG: PLP-dependent transferase [Propionibacteriaceae bacterium]|nr:PLP-dependent transferase [Propionibacteriaceae bacterium]